MATLIVRAGTLIALAAGLEAQSLEAVLSRMDAAAGTFKAMTANIKQTSFTAVLNESTVSAGTIALERSKPKELRMLVEFTSPDVKSVYYENRKFQIYYPKIRTVQEYDLGKQGSLVDQFLLMGFGTRGSDLKASYDLKYLGEDTVEGEKAQRLELTPKSQEALKHVKKLEIWISDSSSQPVQQKVFQPSRDYILITYTNMKVNPALAADAVRLKTPKGVKKEYPQK